jgi:DNA repair ATPase RecN
MSEAQAVEQQPELPNRRTVVSSENSDDFYAGKLGLANGEETPAESEPKAEKEAKDKQKPSKLEKRFSKLTKERQELKANVDRERQAREQLENRLRELEGAKAPQEQKPAVKPRPEQFNDAFEYAEALAEWTAEKAIADKAKADADAKTNEKREKTLKSWSKRVEAFKGTVDNFDSMVQSSDVTVSDDVRDAIIESEFGPQILYHMAENPKFANKLNEMSMSAAMREIGKMEAKFERQSEKASRKAESQAEAPKESVAKKSKAPQPIRPLKATSSAADTPVGSDGEFHGTFAQWREARKAGRIR